MDHSTHAPPSRHAPHAGHGQKKTDPHGGHDHEGMIADYRRRFWVVLVATIPILALAPMIQGWLGLEDALRFPGDRYVLAGLSSLVFFYGGWPFLKGFLQEITARRTPLADGRPACKHALGLMLALQTIVRDIVVIRHPWKLCFRLTLSYFRDKVWHRWIATGHNLWLRV